MSKSNYQAYSIKAKNDVYALLDLNIMRVIVAFIIIAIFPQDTAHFITSLILWLIFLLVLKSSVKHLMIYKQKTHSLYIYNIQGFIPIIDEISANDIEGFSIQSNSKKKYRAVIKLKNDSMIAPVEAFTDHKSLPSLRNAYRLFSTAMKANIAKTTSAAVSESKLTAVKPLPINNKSNHPKSININQTNSRASSKPPSDRSKAVIYSRRGEQPPLVRCRRSGANGVSIVIIVVIAVTIILFKV